MTHTSLKSLSYKQIYFMLILYNYSRNLHIRCIKNQIVDQAIRPSKYIQIYSIHGNSDKKLKITTTFIKRWNMVHRKFIKFAKIKYFSSKTVPRDPKRDVALRWCQFDKLVFLKQWRMMRLRISAAEKGSQAWRNDWGEFLL